MLDQDLVEGIHQLIAGTKKGTIAWTPESDEGDAFRTELGPGGIRLSQGVAFTSGARPLFLDFLDPSGRAVSQYQVDTGSDYPLVDELFRLARSKALKIDETMRGILAEIKKRAG